MIVLAISRKVQKVICLINKIYVIHCMVRLYQWLELVRPSKYNLALSLRASSCTLQVIITIETVTESSI